MPSALTTATLWICSSHRIRRLDLSSRQYYRLREEAVSIISIRLWSVPEGELKQLAGFVEIMEG